MCCVVQVLSAYQLPKVPGKEKRHNIIDPFVRVEVFGVPADCRHYESVYLKDEGIGILLVDS